MLTNYKVQEGSRDKQSKVIEEFQKNGAISTREYELIGVSDYKPSEVEEQRIALIRSCFAKGDTTLRKPRREFNDLSILNRLQVDQMGYNNYLPADGDYAEGDPINSWRSNAQRPIIRNKALSIVAHLTSKTAFPKVFASDEGSDEQKEAAEVMEMLLEWDGEKSNYAKQFLYSVLTCMFSPASILYREYCEYYQTVKTEKVNGKWLTEKRLNEDFSGPQSCVVPVDELFIANAYENDMQKQDWIIWRRVISFDNAMAKYGTEENFKYVRPGMQVIFNDANQTFYEVYDYNVRNDMVEENIYWNKALDLRLVVVNGVLISDVDEANPRQDKMYPFAKTYYESVDEGKFFYGMSLAQKMMQDSKIINYLYQMVLDGSLLKTMPPSFVTGGEMIGNDVMIPGMTTQLTNPDSKLVPIDTGIDINAGINATQMVQQSIDDTTVSPIGQGQAAGGTQTAYEISKLEANANTVIGLTLKMISDLIKQYGKLVMGDVIQYYTVMDVENITGKDSEVYKKFLLSSAEGRSKTAKIDFTTENGDEPMEEDTMLSKGYDLLEKEKEGNDEISLYKVNPVLFRKLKYSIIMTVDTLNPKSKDLERAYKLEAYDRMIMSPIVDQEKITKDFLLGAYEDLFHNTDKYIKEETTPMFPQDQAQEMAQGGQPATNMNPSASLMNKTNQVLTQ